MNTNFLDQLRALANEHASEANEYLLDRAEKKGQPEYGTVYEYEAKIGWHRKTAIALRAAADQLEAVRETVVNNSFQGFDGEEVVSSDLVMAIVYPADMAPQEDRNE